jgi:hypothetical protein
MVCPNIYRVSSKVAQDFLITHSGSIASSPTAPVWRPGTGDDGEMWRHENPNETMGETWVFVWENMEKPWELCENHRKYEQNMGTYGNIWDNYYGKIHETWKFIAGKMIYVRDFPATFDDTRGYL